MNRTLLALPFVLFGLSVCQAQSRSATEHSTAAKVSNTIQSGDILIAGNGDENGSSIGMEAPDDVLLEPLYGRIQLPGNRLSAEKVLAALIILPPKGAHVLGGGSGIDWSAPWIFEGTRTLTEQLHPPDDYKHMRDHDLDYELDGRKKTMKIGAQVFDLTKGKYFVVALDKTWKPRSTQLRDDLKAAPLPAKTLTALRKLLLRAGK